MVLALDTQAALAAWHLQKPVELVLSRLDDLKMTGKRHPKVRI
ncbi:hypothetical protein NIES2098_62880 [Calothrix sp. NIES-2098]|nr:hypothetical protein NIES2098_62880 [Calothrix sp. NIES-2098]